MFKCLSATEGNVALGPEVQFSVRRLPWYTYICSSGDFYANWNEPMLSHVTKPGHRTVKSSERGGIVITWTY